MLITLLAAGGAVYVGLKTYHTQSKKQPLYQSLATDDIFSCFF